MQGQSYPQQQNINQPKTYGNPETSGDAFNPYTMLEGLDKVYIKEKLKMIEFLGVDAKNKYSIMNEDKNELFLAKESTGWCARNCLPHDCRPFELETYIKMPGQGKVNFMKMEKPCQLTCCCINRPRMEVKNNLSGEVIGYLRDPFDCFNYVYTVADSSEKKQLTVKASCCQPGIWCGLPCGPCSEVHFEITNATSKEKVGNITKKISLCGMIAEDMMDNYWVEFGTISDPQWKAMLINLALFIDMRMFQGSNKDDGTGVII
eukprot:GHVR01171336.1.p1 GENE.GHVR01171336.1~~GHVR01171336.1.p1  ORF type:complete len:262 (+),score=34.00 GHVR01171336.1:52-837(+)